MMMGKRSLLTRSAAFWLLLLFLVAPQGALAASDSYYEQKSFTLEPGGSVVVEAVFHDVEVTQTAGPTIEVEVSMKVRASSKRTVRRILDEYQPVFTVDGKRLQIRSKPAGRSSSSLSHQVSGKIKIAVPAGTDLAINTASGNCTFRGSFDAAIATKTASGNITIRGAVESFTANTASGEIRADFEKPVHRIEAKSVSGSIRVNGSVQNAQVESVSGGIKLDGLRGGELNAATVSGNINASWETLTERVILSAESVSGNLRFSLPPGTTVSGEIRSRHGRISTDLGENSGAKYLFMEDEEADAQVFASTVSGMITLRTKNHASNQPRPATETMVQHDHFFTNPPDDPPPAVFLNLYRYEKRLAPGLKIRLCNEFYVTGNFEYSYEERDLNLQLGAVYFLNSASSGISFYGGGGAHFSRTDGYQYPYLVLGTDFFFLFYELVYPWATEAAPQHRFGLSIEL